MTPQYKILQLVSTDDVDASKQSVNFATPAAVRANLRKSDHGTDHGQETAWRAIVTLKFAPLSPTTTCKKAGNSYGKLASTHQLQTSEQQDSHHKLAARWS